MPNVTPLRPGDPRRVGRYRLTGRVEAPTRDLIRARYEDPDGTSRFCHNSEIASSRLVLVARTRRMCSVT